MKTSIETGDVLEPEPAVSWICNDNQPIALHFFPHFWAIVRTVAVMKNAGSPQDMIHDTVVMIIKNRCFANSEAVETLEFCWRVLGDEANDEIEAILTFPNGGMQQIAGWWQESIEDTEDAIATALIQEVLHEHGPEGHA